MGFKLNSYHYCVYWHPIQIKCECFCRLLHCSLLSWDNNFKSLFHREVIFNIICKITLELTNRQIREWVNKNVSKRSLYFSYFDSLDASYKVGYHSGDWTIVDNVRLCSSLPGSTDPPNRACITLRVPVSYTCSLLASNNFHLAPY